jgi:4-amino-4-deoxy-L-arabinose transferase-like glycosyltransferase
VTPESDRAAGTRQPLPSLPRRLAATALWLAGALAVGIGVGIAVLVGQRRYGEAWLAGAVAAALVGLALVIGAVRILRVPTRRGLIVALGAMLVALPVSRMVTDNLRGATAQAPEKRTEFELRNLGFALESRAVDTGDFPAEASLDAVARALEPRYVKSIPREDAWGRPLRYATLRVDGEQRYFLGSAGADGRWERESLAEYAAATSPSGDDIVYGNGGFLARPPANPPSR